MRIALSLLVALVATVALLVYAARGIDFVELERILATARLGGLTVFLPATVLFFWLKAFRWRVILGPLGRFRVAEVAPAMMIGFAGNNLLPAHLGELVRVAVFARRHRVPVGSVLSSLLVERLMDVAAVVTIYFLAVLSLPQASGALEGAAIAAVTALLAGAGLARWLLAKRDRVDSLCGVVEGWLPRRVAMRVRPLVGDLLDGVESLRAAPTVAGLLVNSLAQWSLMALCVWVSLDAFGVEVSPGLAMLTLAVTVIAVALPSLPGYFGAMQAAFVVALTPFGVTQEAAFAASVFFLVAQWLPVTAVGVGYLLVAGVDLRSVRRDVERVREG